MERKQTGVKKIFNGQLFLGVLLVVSSTAFYFFHYLIFRDAHHIFIYLIGDVAFVFIEVLLVTLIIHRLLSNREKRARLEKLNLVIEAFFIEAGMQLLSHLSDFDPDLDEVRDKLVVTENWSEKEFSGVNRQLKDHPFKVEIQKIDLESLKVFLNGKRDFLLRLLENPTVLEHESFTALLRAVSHLAVELNYRPDTRRLPSADLKHLTGDVKRVYVLLVHHWLEYMKYLRNHYPYLLSLAMRINPFDRNASPVIQ